MNASDANISGPNPADPDRPDLHILYMDNHLLVVNKPPGMLVQQDETNDPDLLRLGKRYLKETFEKKGQAFLGLVHRLDRPASGVVVLARTSKAAARLSDQFRQRTPEKEYFALVEGVCRGSGTLRHTLAASVRGGVRIVPTGDASGKEARLQWRSLGVQDDLSLLSVRLETGRKHQIRVQFSAEGHPILGDFRYGAVRELDGRNLALHAFRLTVAHPVTRERITFCTPPPPAWGTLFAREIAQALASSDASAYPAGP